MPTLQRTAMLERRARMDGWFATHHGVITLRHLMSFGYSRATVYRMLDRGELTQLLPAVFQASSWPSGPDQRMAAVCLRNPAVTIGHLTAASMWGLRRLPKEPLIHLLVPHGCTFSPGEGYVVHRCRRIDPVDIVQRADGIRLVSPTRAAFDIADVVLDAALVSILDQLVNDDHGTMATHIATFARLGHSRRPGTATMARVIRGRPTWRAAMQSDLEVRVLAEIQRQGLPTPEVQHPVLLPDGRMIRFDFAWPQYREALEVDHPFWHAGGDASDRDKRRDRKGSTVGWHTTRITDVDVRHGLADAIADVAAIIAMATRRAV